MMFRALILAICFWPAVVLAEDDAAAMARMASEQLEEASKSLSAAETARDRISALTKTVRAYEAGLSAMRESLRHAALEERAKRASLQGKEEELARILAAIQNIERTRGNGASLLHPEGPLPAIRAGMLAGDLVPALNERAQTLAGEVEEVAAIVALQRAGEAQLERGLESIRNARLALTDAVSQRASLPDSVTTDDAAMNALINSAETLSAFADNLVTESPWKGTVDERWAMPVLGRVLRKYDEADAAGVRRPGWLIATRPGAVIVSPSDATVRFAGAMPDFDVVAILEPRAGELLILAGAGALFVQRGQIVSKGALIGFMGGEPDATQDKLIETSVGSGQREPETLYIELRQGKDAIDP
ncbi:MAG: murein hydrolase activator EnvC family protein, partial [Boseongicola sp.]